MTVDLMRKRVRQHVNPLSQKYQAPPPPPDWASVYRNPNQPLHLDIGCGRGQFLFAMAEQQPDWNFLGWEIREPLVHQAERQRQEQGLTNLHFIFCNANTSVRSLLSSLPARQLHQVTIQFPDPWFKKRHQKRRVVQPDLVAALAEYLVPGGILFVQSDVEAVAQAMVDCIADHEAFVVRSRDWLPENPLPAQTEREQVTLAQNKPVYRALFHCRRPA